MAQVKFYRGNISDYNDTYKEGIYFSMDEKVLYHRGVKFGGIDPKYFSGVTKDFDIDGQTVKFKKFTDKGGWDEVTINLVAAADNSIEIGTITNTEGNVNDGFTVKVKADYAADGEDGLKLDNSKGLYVDLTDTNAAIAANTAKIATNKNAIDANKAAIDTLNGDADQTGSVAKSIKDAIWNINTAVTINANQVITAITQTDGKVTTSTTDLIASNVSASPIASGDTTVAVTGTTVAAQIESLATSIHNVASEAKRYQIQKINTGLSANVKEAYKLVDEDGTQAGETINIYKDSSLVSLFVAKEDKNGNITIDGTKYSKNTSGQILIYEYLNANGTTEYAAVDLSNFLLDSEYGAGLQTLDGVISVKIAEGSEGFLSVDTNGVKLSGVTDAISAASGHVNTIIDARLGSGVTSESTATAQFAALSGQITSINATIENLDATVSGESTHVDVTVAQANGIITSVTVANKDIASASALTQEVADRQAAIAALDLPQVGGTDKVITTISQADGKVSASAIDLTASNVKATASSSSATAVAVDGATVEAQIASLAKSIKSASTAAAAAHTVVNPKNDGGHVKVTVSNDGTHDVVTIAENDIASASDLNNETTNRQNQDNTIEAAVGLNENGNHVQTSGHYTSDATTVVGEIAALDTQLYNVSKTLEWIDCGEYGKA